MDFLSKRNCSVEISSFLRYPSSRFYRSKIWNWGYCPKSWNWGFWMWRFVRQRVLKFAFAWSADFASRYRCELWMYFYQGPVKLGFQFCRICGIVRCSDKSQLALVCSDVFIFYPLQQLKLSLRYLGHISWRILLYTRIPLNLPNEVLESDSSLLTQFLKCQTLRSVQVVYRIGYLLLFFCRFWHILLFLSRA